MSKKPPELTWQDVAVLVTIPLSVFAIFLFANHMGRDLTVTEAFRQQLRQAEVRDGGTIVRLVPPEAQTATGPAYQRCWVRSRDGQTEFLFQFNITGTETLPLQIGRTIQFFGKYRYDARGGIVEAPFKGKSGRHTGWAVYENRRYYAHDDYSGAL